MVDNVKFLFCFSLKNDIPALSAGDINIQKWKNLMIAIVLDDKNIF